MAQPTYDTVALLNDSRVTSSGIERYKIINNTTAPDIYTAISGDDYLIPDKLVITLIDGETVTTKIGNDSIWSECTDLSGGGGELPTGDPREVIGFNSEGTAEPIILGWRQFSDLPTPPPFSNGVLTGTAFNAQGDALFAFVELALGAGGVAVLKPNAIPFYNPGQVGTGGGTLPVATGIAATDAVNKAQLDATVRSPATVAPLAAGTAAIGTSPLYARQDHVHPVQPTVAALTTGRTFSLSGGATGTSAAFSGAANASIPVTLSIPTAAVRGGVIQQAAIADLTAAPTEVNFNLLLTALRAAGILAT